MILKRMLLAVSLAATLPFVAASTGSLGTAGQVLPAQSALGLSGSWYATISPDGPPPFRGLITADGQGGVVASAQGDILLNAGSLATAGHGAWKRIGPRRYLVTFRQVFYDSDGGYDGGSLIRNDVELSRDGQEFHGSVQFEWYDPNDDLVFTGVSPVHATRIHAEALMP
ncbi:hypothetical protein BH23PSE2_BH23PSE2_02480 [soil metagenome]